MLTRRSLVITITSLVVLGSIITFTFAGMAISKKKDDNPIRAITNPNIKTAIFSMGGFLFSEPAFTNQNTKEKLPGILSIRVGYAKNRTVPKQNKNHADNHKESIRIIYNSSLISYEKLLEIFWHNIDPFDETGQFCHKGHAYTSAIFVTDKFQKSEAIASKKRMEFQLGKKISTPIIESKNFDEAEEKYQNFFKKNPIRYTYEQWNCKRDKLLKAIWGDISYLHQ